ncbi:MAG TPA: NAD(P)H-dependent oxidoreductase [Candidatus Micrarchaeota archaeon]|nr:NAD(P)H-dependent oxidoreductase [Candidatus Micrarchaeota archaeon]
MQEKNDEQLKVIESLNWRYATKSFDPEKKVSDADLGALLESLRLAPSSFGLQPWKFIVISDKKAKERLMAACWNQQQIVQAPYVIAICTPKELGSSHVSAYMASIAGAQPAKDGAEKEKENARLASFQKRIEEFMAAMPEEELKCWAKRQAYIAFGFLLYACAQLRVDACPMEGFAREQAEEVLGLGKMGLELAVLAPIGYRSENDSHAKEAKVRFDAKDVIINI